MSAATAIPVPPRTLPPMPVPLAEPALERPTRRQTLLQAWIAAGCELICLAAQAAVALVTSREHDARADAHVARIDGLAQRIAREASIRTLTPERAMGYALLIRRHCDGYRQDDGAEDSWIEKARAHLLKSIMVTRGINRSTDRELMKRGVPVVVS